MSCICTVRPFGCCVRDRDHTADVFLEDSVTDAPMTLGQLVAERGRRRTLSAGEALFCEGDPSNSVYACLHGRVRLFVTSPAGRTMLLGIKTPGQVFGELSAIDGRPRSAGATATELTVVAQLPAADFLESLRIAPQLAVTVLSELSDHLRRSNQRIVEREGNSTTVRTGRLLIELGAKFRRHGDPALPVVVPISQDELAAWIGATREASARALAQFRRAGVIETGRQRITIRNLDELATVTEHLALA